MNHILREYESVYYDNESGNTIIIARGNKEYCKKIAEQAQLHPYTIRECPQSKKAIAEMYKEWRKENGNKKPNRVIVKMHWEDEDNTDKGFQVDTIAIHHGNIDISNLPKDDAVILFYVTSLKGLQALTEHNNGSDFVVEEVLEFYKK